MIAVIHAEIKTMEEHDISDGYLLADGEKIVELASMSDWNEDKAQACAKIIDAQGRTLTPGLVDAHTHMGMWEDGLGFEGADGNEETDPVTPHLRALDGVNPMDVTFREALSAGVTTVVTGPGSANPIGGQLLAMKTRGHRIDDMVIRAPLGIKAALGENPKSVYNDKNQSPITRMATAALIRETLEKAQEYREQWDNYHTGTEDEEKPDIDYKMEAMLPVVRGEIPLHIHAHRADDIFTAIRIAKEFEIDMVLVHCTEGHLIAEELKEEGYPILIGPVMTDRSKPELRNQTVQNPVVLSEEGIPISIITDHPETPIQYLRLSAALAVQNGMAKNIALQSITRNPAESVGIFDRVGSLRVGKDADFVIWEGDPFSLEGKPFAVFCDGINTDI